MNDTCANESAFEKKSACSGPRGARVLKMHKIWRATLLFYSPLMAWPAELPHCNREGAMHAYCRRRSPDGPARFTETGRTTTRPITHASRICRVSAVSPVDVAEAVPPHSTRFRLLSHSARAAGRITAESRQNRMAPRRAQQRFHPRSVAILPVPALCALTRFLCSPPTAHRFASLPSPRR